MLFKIKVLFWASYEYLRDHYILWRRGIRRETCDRCGAPYDYNDSITFENGAKLCYECDADDRADALEYMNQVLDD